MLFACNFAPAGSTADEKAADLIIGKWVPASGKEKAVFVEFTKDGAMNYTFGTTPNQMYQGKYRVINEKTVEVEWSQETLKKNEFLNKKPKKGPLQITKDTMTFDPTLVTKGKKKWVRAK